MLQVKESIKIDDSLQVRLSYEGIPLPLPDWLRSAPNAKICRLSMLENLPTYINSRAEELPPSEILSEMRSISWLKPKGRPPCSSSVIRFSLLLRYSSRQVYALLLKELPMPSFSVLQKLQKGSVDSMKAAKLL